MSLAPQNLADEKAHRTLIAQAANAALRGETYNVGTFTVAGTPETEGLTAVFTLENQRIGPGKQIVLAPADAAAAGLAWYVSEMRKGEADIVFISAPSGEAKFTYSVFGVGKTTGA